MENKNNWWVIILGIVFALVAAVVIIWIVNMGQKDDIIIDDNTTTYDLLQDLDKDETQHMKSYYLSYDGQRVVIYSEPDRNFYDYADINMEVLPPDIREQLKLGMYIDGEDNLYDFLQTYSS